MRTLILRGFFGFFAVGFSYAALHLIKFSEAVPIMQTAPMWTAVFSVLLIGEKLTIDVILNIVLCFSGVLLITLSKSAKEDKSLPTSDSARMLGICCCLLSSLGRASVNVLIRKTGKKVNILSFAFYFYVANAMFSMPCMMYEHWGDHPISDYLYVAGIAIFAYVAQLCYTRGLQLEKAAKVAALAYTQIMWAAILDIVVFHQQVNGFQLAGIFCILGCAIVMIFFNKASD
eukprot:TRINITY_DN6377_c0_g1_i4.p1 TRINITY_DN6377_c0_g1~~TRINITY_DN6377_c0_g1_i4.p1  ORF type:complete len:231 (-),score=9.94 TRINITY_DN6377_c0_g1_i4:4-696(-)